MKIPRFLAWTSGQIILLQNETMVRSGGMVSLCGACRTCGPWWSSGRRCPADRRRAQPGAQQAVGSHSRLVSGADLACGVGEIFNTRLYNRQWDGGGAP